MNREGLSGVDAVLGEPRTKLLRPDREPSHPVATFGGSVPNDYGVTASEVRPEPLEMIKVAYRQVHLKHTSADVPVGGEESELVGFDLGVYGVEEAEEYVSPLPRDRTGGLIFRKRVPEALLHLSRNNRQAVHSQAMAVQRDVKRAVASLAERMRGAGGSVAAAVSLLYWHCPDVPVRVMRTVFDLEPQEAQRLAEKNPTVTFRCLDCDRPLTPESRHHFRQMWLALKKFDREPVALREYFYTGLHCEVCTEVRQHRWGDEWQTQENEYQQRLLELRTMPYPEYLQTPEWRMRRQRKLEQADHRCSFCNRYHPSLNVHHRTYQNLGEELDSDLTVLCPPCHKKHHGIR